MKRIGQTRGVPPCFFVRDAAKGLSSREIGGGAGVDFRRVGDRGIAGQPRVDLTGVTKMGT
jgi:hypothetical protein